ncbi:MAG: sulfate transporter CysZ [Vibrio sp.]
MHPTRSGFGYFYYGLCLAFTPGIRRFVALPLLANMVLVGSAMYYLFSQLDMWISQWLGHLPLFLAWLRYVLWPLLALTIIATFSYFFSTLANFIAAPFNGLLAEKIEQHLSGQVLSEQSVWSLIKDVPHILAREWRKLLYMLPRALGLLVLLLIPAIGQTVGPLAWLLFSAWMLAIQYCDYPFDNHKIAFDDMRNTLQQNQAQAYSFGLMVALLASIPIINLFIMPVAVCGATAMWVEKFKPHYTQTTWSYR